MRNTPYAYRQMFLRLRLCYRLSARYQTREILRLDKFQVTSSIPTQQQYNPLRTMPPKRKATKQQTAAAAQAEKHVEKTRATRSTKVNEEKAEETVKKQTASDKKKTNKKDMSPVEEINEKEEVVTEPPAKKPRAKRNVAEKKDEGDQKKPAPVPKNKKDKKTTTAVSKPKEDEDEEETTSEGPPKKRTRAPANAALKNKTESDFSSIDYTCDRKNIKGENHNLKISSWNVDGIRAWLKKGCLKYLTEENPDIFCLQETKCNSDQLPDEVKTVEGYHVYWCTSEKSGYAGVGLYTKEEPLNVIYGLGDEEHDAEGRIITAEYENFYLVNTYVPNAGRKLVTLPKRLEWNDLFLNHIKNLDKKKPVIVCGDMNVSHNEIDLANPKTNKKNAGFTQEERDGMTKFLEEGFVDTFRNLYPDETGAYTFWTYMSNARSKNVGWRLDYFIVSERLKDSVCENVIRKEVYGSDHCPITLFIHI